MSFKRQCRLEIKAGDTRTTTTTWIDEKIAVVGKFVECMGKKWEVVFVSKARMTAENVNDRSRDYLRTREASDI